MVNIIVSLILIILSDFLIQYFVVLEIVRAFKVGSLCWNKNNETTLHT